MEPKNLVFILSDEHQRDVAGCYGDPIAITPNIDALAARGTRFTNAYTPCPICVPARAALATGRWVHQTGSWDNAAPYHGEATTWHHRLRSNGHSVVSIGKLHFRATEDDNGFSEEILPLHVLDGIGDLIGMLREPPASRGSMPALAESAGPGNSTYNDYDSAIATAACEWIAAHAAPQRQALGAVRIVRAAALPAHGAVRILQALSARTDGDAAALRCSRASAPSCDRGAQDGDELRRLLQGRADRAARSRLILRAGQLSRPQHRAGHRGDREGRADVVDPRDLHVRSRRQSRLPRTLGQVRDVRGVGRDPDDRRGRRRRRRRSRRYAGFPHRLLPNRA